MIDSDGFFPASVGGLNWHETLVHSEKMKTLTDHLIGGLSVSHRKLDTSH